MALQIDKRRRNDILIGSCIAAVIAVISFLIGAQVYGAPGDPPSNGLTSRIKTLYDSLSTLTYGSDTNSPDRGTYWNRIFTAGEWTPSGTVTEADVLAGKTFYNTSRTVKTGTRYRVGYCPTQAYVDTNSNQLNSCITSITWTDPTDAVEGSYKQDPITNLVWSNPLYVDGGAVTFNQYSKSSWSWNASAANNVTVGNKTATLLCSERGNGWRLPSLKEHMQAYIDGGAVYLNLPGNYWTKTYYTNVGYMMYFDYVNGVSSYLGLGSTANVRCVRDAS